MRKLLIAAMILLTATIGFAQSAKVRGKVLDSSGLIMPGATVKLLQGDKIVKEGATTATGDFDLAVNPGDYRLEVSAPDFATSTQPVKAAANPAPINVKLTLAVLATNVDVTENSNAVSIDADSSLSTTTLAGDSIAELPDDETELAAYLQQIAGSRGGAESGGGNGGFVIDGFSGGRLPPKDQIQEIRINNNPYSTEFSGLGFGRVEIITRAGTGNFNGNMQFNFRDESLNANNPFSTEKRPPYQTRNFNTNYGGPIIKNKLTMNFRANNNEQDNSGVIRALVPASISPTGSFNQSWVNPSVNRGANVRGQYAITKNQVLNFNYSYGSNKRTNQGLSEFTLPSRASDSKSSNYEIQIRETAIMSTSLVHEMRFEVGRDKSNQTPRTAGITINVLDAFNGGGGQNRNSSNNRNLEFGNLLLYSKAKWTSKAGMQISRVKNHSESYNNYTGTYSFSNLADYLAGKPLQFTQTTGNPILDSRQTEFGVFWQNDWKITPKFSFSGGVRYESQTNLKDFNNIDPRIGFAFGLTKTSLIRGGAGIFHQRLNINNVQQLMRFDGTRQLQITVPNPFYDPASPPAGAAATPGTIRVRAEDLTAPYNANTSLSLEKSWPHGFGTTFSWDTTRGIHLFRSRNLNAPYPGTAISQDLQDRLNSRDAAVKAAAREQVDRLRPLYPNVGNVNQLESTGKSRSNNFNIGFRESQPKIWNLQIFGSYGLGYNRSDTNDAFGLPMNGYNLAQEWSRSQFDTRHRFNTGINLRWPSAMGLARSSNMFAKGIGNLWNASFGNMFTMLNINASSARPFNITTGRDNNGDTSINDRPDGYSRNAGIGHDNYNVNLNFSKTYNLKHERSGGGGSGNGVNPYLASFAEPQRGGGGFPGGFPGGGGGEQRGPGGGPGGGDRGGQRGGPGGPGGRGQQPSRGPTMSFTANVNNLLNNTQYGNFSGVMTSPFFGKPTNAQNWRQVNLGLRFNF